MGRVRIGTCSSPAEAMFLRSMFAARGIEIVVGAERHASLLGPIAGGFLSMDIWVDDEDAEEASALLRDLREREAADGGAAAGDDAAADEAEPADDDDGGPDDPAARLERRRRTGAALLLGAFVTFGTAHMFTGAWRRGFALAALELTGIVEAAMGHSIAGALVPVAILSDLIGAVWRTRARPSRALPRAIARRA